MFKLKGAAVARTRVVRGRRPRLVSGSVLKGEHGASRHAVQDAQLSAKFGFSNKSCSFNTCNKNLPPTIATVLKRYFDAYFSHFIGLA